ncbi:MAG TPA: amidohydrolase family protein [Vicinamibacterales bacterium]|jgi:imidazolonepropionase-like amidohydrolase|nr:amidohydrolase family protein [Vicinamibacterales bacterium]
MTLSRHLAIAACLVSASLVTLPAQSPGGVKAFTGARVIDGTDRAPIDNATILVRDGRIVSVGPAARVTVPAGAERVSLAGKHLMPGLVNAHGHVGNTVGMEQGHYSAENVLRDLRTYAAYGVTTVFSLGDDQDAGFKARDAQNTPALDRARLFVAGPVLAPKSPDEARTLVDGVAAMKADIVKIRVDDNLGATPKMAPAIYKAVIDEAHKKGMRAAVHLFYLEDAKGVLEAGADFIAHSVRDVDVDEAFVAMLKRRDVCYCPTLMREVSTFVYESTPSWFSDPLFLKHADMKTVEQLKEPARQAQMKNSRAAQRYKAGLEVANRNLKKLSDAGVKIAMGTDTGPPARFQGYFELMELEMMAKAGLTPKQVLASATRDAARCQKLDKDLGTLEAGKWADFVVLDADPLADISNTRKINSVWIAGNRAAE